MLFAITTIAPKTIASLRSPTKYSPRARLGRVTSLVDRRGPATKSDVSTVLPFNIGGRVVNAKLCYPEFSTLLFTLAWIRETPRCLGWCRCCGGIFRMLESAGRDCFSRCIAMVPKTGGRLSCHHFCNIVFSLLGSHLSVRSARRVCEVVHAIPFATCSKSARVSGLRRLLVELCS